MDYIKVKISNNPDLDQIEREFEIREVRFDLKSFAEVEGFLIQKGDFLGIKKIQHYNLRADTTLKVNEQGDYDENGTTTEYDFFANIPLLALVQMTGKEINELKLKDIMEVVATIGVIKQDSNGRFNQQQ